MDACISMQIFEKSEGENQKKNVSASIRRHALHVGVVENYRSVHGTNSVDGIDRMCMYVASSSCTVGSTYAPSMTVGWRARV